MRELVSLRRWHAREWFGYFQTEPANTQMEPTRRTGCAIMSQRLAAERQIVRPAFKKQG